MNGPMASKHKLKEKVNYMVKNEILTTEELIEIYLMFIDEKPKFSKNRNHRFLNLKYFSDEIVVKILNILEKKEQTYKKSQKFSSLISDLPSKSESSQNSEQSSSTSLLTLLSSKKRPIEKTTNEHVKSLPEKDIAETEEKEIPPPPKKQKKKINGKILEFYTYVPQTKFAVKKIFESKKKPLSYYKGVYQRLIKNSNRLLQKPISKQYKHTNSILLGPSYEDEEEEQVLELLEPDDIMCVVNSKKIVDDDNDDDDDDEEDAAEEESKTCTEGGCDDEEDDDALEDDNDVSSEQFSDESDEDFTDVKARESLKRLSERYH